MAIISAQPLWQHCPSVCSILRPQRIRIHGDFYELGSDESSSPRVHTISVVPRQHVQPKHSSSVL
eukprot:125030-Prorocentrum_lima.AAC.1